MSDAAGNDEIAKFRWIPPGLRPPVPMTVGQERFILLVGVAALFAGYDLNIASASPCRRSSRACTFRRTRSG